MGWYVHIQAPIPFIYKPQIGKTSRRRRRHRDKLFPTRALNFLIIDTRDTRPRCSHSALIQKNIIRIKNECRSENQVRLFERRHTHKHIRTHTPSANRNRNQRLRWERIRWQASSAQQQQQKSKNVKSFNLFDFPHYIPTH